MEMRRDTGKRKQRAGSEERASADILVQQAGRKSSDQHSHEAATDAPSSSRKKAKLDIEGKQPTAAHLQAESLHTLFYNKKGGLEQMMREHPEQARLVQELRAMRDRGTEAQKAALQTLRAQQGAPSAPSIDIAGKQPTAAHLQAESLHTLFYNKKGGLEQMMREHPGQARLMQELKAMQNRGTAEQQAMIQALRAQQGAPSALSIYIEERQPTLAHLEAETLYRTSYNKQGGMEQMRKEHSEQARLLQELGAMRQRGTVEQQAAIHALRRLRKQRVLQEAKGEMAGMERTSEGPGQQEQEEMSPEEVARIRQRAYEMYQESYQRGGEEGLRHMQQASPASFEIALEYQSQRRAHGERSAEIA